MLSSSSKKPDAPHAHTPGKGPESKTTKNVEVFRAGPTTTNHHALWLLIAGVAKKFMFHASGAWCSAQGVNPAI
jgi:hypothetical protein